MRGLEYSHKPGGPLHQVFSARARSLCEPDSAQALSSYLSGILIGSEFSGALDMYSPAGDCLLVAAKRLRQPYQVAGEFFKCPLQFIDPSQATARGLAAISGAELEPTPC